ncbi:flagellar hook-basal body complex protein FliE [Bacillus fonticola]|uniref:flagellar hook-basal body complex protein FliE n=1 Tax=Bacillus fonticola TaxID=2728853 RepID=UPI001472FA8F|nr:flagellar hook-basal body complex protein FliE [Bacillus fonticola]
MNHVGSVFSALPSVQPLQKKETTPAEFQQSFAEVLQQSIQSVNDAGVQSDLMTERLVRGENVQLQDVMITSQKASITLQTAIEVRNKAIEAYQEMMRMQI